jgi:hypothetical protein
MSRPPALAMHGTRFGGAPGAAVAPHYVQFAVPLDSMMNNWTTAERQTGRRLVRFTILRGHGGYRTVSCCTIKPSEYVPADLTNTISCIAKPTGGYVITSVDLLNLASLLYGGKPEVDERNRLRRHLERLEPRTIGKHRDQGGLYARIASFNEPRALTIIKDVKVFEWTRLEDALEAIMAKRVGDADRFPPARL